MIDIKNYDNDNIFPILTKQFIKKFMKTEVLLLKDINPQAPSCSSHTKERFCSLNDFCLNDNETISDFIRSIEKIAKILKLSNGYRIISNIGKKVDKSSSSSFSIRWQTAGKIID